MALSRFSHRFAAAVAAAITLLAINVTPAAAAKGGKIATVSGGSGHFVLLGTHPQAAQQATAMGRTIQTLVGWNGQIYSGYGDYGANTGPIAITPFDPAAGTFASTPDLTHDLTEQIDISRNICGRLYAPSIDPKGGVSTDFAVGS